MAFMTEVVVRGIQYPGDLVAGENEQTLYLANIQSTPGGPHNGVHASGQVLRIDMPNAPASMAGATATPIMGGLANPAFLARATGSGRMVVQCYGYTGNGYASPTARRQALLECPSGGEAWYCLPPGEGGTWTGPNTAAILGPRSVALSPDGQILYVWEGEIPSVNDFYFGALRVIGSGEAGDEVGRVVMWQNGFAFSGLGCFPFADFTPFTYMDPSGQYLWFPGSYSFGSWSRELTRMSVNTRGLGDLDGCTNTADVKVFGGQYRAIGFQNPLPNAMNPDPVHPFVKTPGFLSNRYNNYVYRFNVPDAAGAGYGTFAYRSPSPYTTGNPDFYNVQGMAVTPGGQVFVSCGSWGKGGMDIGNHLGLGTPYLPGTVVRINGLAPLPADQQSDTQPGNVTEMALVKGWNSPLLLDDHPLPV